MADSGGRYGDYGANMGADTSTRNSNYWDINNTGESGFAGVAGQPNNQTARDFNTVMDYVGGKAAKDFIHGRFDTPGVQYQAQAYDPNTAAGRIGYESQRRYGQAAQDAQGRQAAQMQAARAGASEFRGGQADFMGELQRRAMGQGPSVAQLQLQQGLDQNIAAAKAMQAGSSNPALAQRSAVNAMAQAQGAANQQMAQLRASEMMQAGNQYMGALGQARGQDQSLALANAGFQQGANQQNLGAQMQQQQMNDQMTQYYISQGFSEDQARQKAAMELEQMRGTQALEVQRINADIAKTNQQAQAKNTQLGPQLVGTILGAFSDERTKTNIKDGGRAVDEMLSKLSPREFDYKPEFGSKGYLGFMAQDLEKSQIGKRMVYKDAATGMKKFDMSKALMASMASNARLHERLKKLEEKKG